MGSYLVCMLIASLFSENMNGRWSGVAATENHNGARTEREHSSCLLLKRSTLWFNSLTVALCRFTLLFTTSSIFMYSIHVTNACSSDQVMLALTEDTSYPFNDVEMVVTMTCSGRGHQSTLQTELICTHQTRREACRT